MNTRRSESLGALHDDERGAILVMGIFMCTCLVGALWYLASIGDSILYRERMQEASDAVVFSNAVLRARGMNLIVFLNIVMACVLSVRVLLKVTQLLLGIAAGVFFALSFLAPPLADAAALCLEGVSEVQKLIDQTRPPINNTLKGLSFAQKAIVKATPAAADAGAMFQVAGEYEPLVTKALVLDTDVVAGLPVTRGSESKLCGEAAGAITELTSWMLGKVGLSSIGAAVDWLTPKFSGIVAAAPGFFCEMGPMASPDGAADSLYDEAADQECGEGGPVAHYDQADDAWHAECEKAKVTCKSGDGISPYGQQLGSTSNEEQQKLDTLNQRREESANTANQYKNDFGAISPDYEQCRIWSKSRMKATSQDAMKNAKSGEKDKNTEDMTGKQVSADWVNGGAGGQIVGGVLGDPSGLQRSVDLVRVGGMKRRQGANADPPLPAKLPAWSQAEFFYDCAGAWGGKECNEKEDAMWHLQWRARLRRYDGSKPIDKLGELVAAGASLGGAFTGARAILANPGLDQPVNDLIGNGALVIELGEAMATPDVLVRGIH